MKSLLRRNALVLLFTVAAVARLTAALTPTEWQHRQTLTVATPGLTQVELPAATFDAAQPTLSDLRLVDPSGQEVPYLLDRDLPGHEVEPLRWLRPASFRPVSNGDTTQLILETGTTELLEVIELETPMPYFLKAAHVDVSADGTNWESLGTAVPLFRQFGAEQLRLELNRRPAAFIRVTLDDFHSRQIPFTGAKLLPAPLGATPPGLKPLGARITRREEFAGETVLTLTLDGAHVPLAGIGLEVTDPLFMRRVTVAVREARGSTSEEATVASGTLYRVALEGVPAHAQLDVPIDYLPLTRELLVHIHNGDSPPLTLDGVHVQQHPVNLLFLARAAGAFSVLSGNPQAVAPRYDLLAFARELHKAGATRLVPGDLEAMPNYHPRESLTEAPLPDVPLAGAPLDATNWTGHRPIMIDRIGVQELELDLAALAHARADYADVRVLHAGNQIPYLLEQPPLSRSLTLTPLAVPDAKRPSVSVWQLKLPDIGPPLRCLVLTSTTPLFSREFRIYEKITTTDGRTYEAELASGAWSRTPEPGQPLTSGFELADRVRTDTIWIESDNGDNPAIALGSVRGVYPVVRLIFKVAVPDGFTLIYTNPAASAPRYDLSLVAAKLLTASRNVAKLAPSSVIPVVAPHGLAALNGGYIFWGALALVVIGLLVVVAKLLPKPPVA